MRLRRSESERSKSEDIFQCSFAERLPAHAPLLDSPHAFFLVPPILTRSDSVSATVVSSWVFIECRCSFSAGVLLTCPGARALCASSLFCKLGLGRVVAEAVRCRDEPCRNAGNQPYISFGNYGAAGIDPDEPASREWSRIRNSEATEG